MHLTTPSQMLLKDDFDHIFQDDAELVQFLEKVGAAHGGDAEMAQALGLSTTNSSAAPISLQFLPPEPLGAGLDTAGSTMSSLASFADDLSPVMSSGIMSQQHLNALGFLAMQQQPGSATAADTANLMPGQNTASLLSSHHVPPIQPPTATAGPIARGMKVPDTKPQVSHSTVEKQRRDRINALIDELRELVPPAKATLGGGCGTGSGKDTANTEARRPKHVVLADTIALLKQLQTKAPLAQLLSASQQPNGTLLTTLVSGQRSMQPTTHATLALSGSCVGVKEEAASPTNSNSKGSVSSHEDVDMKDDSARTAAPKLPNIPMQPTLLSGVTVERGPDCMYVQIKCRDRKGLLLDIINALKVLPLEVRTAAVTTQPDGLVRDVFEVCVDDDQLQPEDVQNMVHEALFQPYVHPDMHKRARC